MTLSIRERIIDHLHATLLGIGSANSVLHAQNATGATVTASGTFTGTAFKLWRVYITTGGASGVAKAEIKNMFGESVVSSNNTVTTATPISIEDGVSVTIAFASPVADNPLVEGDCWFVRSGAGSVSPPASFSNTIIDVTKETVITGAPRNLPSIVIFDDVEPSDPTHSYDEHEMNLKVYAWARGETRSAVDLQRVNESGRVLSSLVADIELAIKSDPTRNGLAIDTQIATKQNGADVSVGRNAFCEIGIQINYKTLWENPTSQ